MPSVSPLLGKNLLHYRIVERIGAGGMGEVYRAHDERLERDVAVKLLLPGAVGDEDARKRFRKEALALSRLNHPNVATVFDFVSEGNVDLLVTEYIPGITLNEKLRAGPLSEKETVRLGLQLAEGLEAAHEQNLVHRDLKPGNLRITPEGRLKILDFGLARVVQTDEAAVTANLTRSQEMSGTLPYMAPEQLSGRNTDVRSDIWSAGAVLYEMVTAQRSFPQTNGALVIDAILNKPPLPPAMLNRSISSALEAVILKALDKDPGQRFQSVHELRVELERLSQGLTTKIVSRKSVPSAIAVLPFTDMSTEKDQEYFCDGMAEELIDALAQVEGLRVVSRASSFQFRGHAGDLQAIREKLKVDTVLEGSVRRAGTRLRISARLINAHDGFQSWAQKYDREMKDVFEVQEEIAQAIVGALKIKLVTAQEGALVKRRTESLEAYQLYLKGRYYWNRRVPGALQKAREHFQQALEADPGYAPALAGIADCLIVPGYYGLARPLDVYPPARAAALKALALDPSLGEAHASLGMVATYEFQWAAAERHFLRAQELSPHYATALIWNAFFVLVPLGRLDEAWEQCERAQALDPLSAVVGTVKGATLYYQKKYDEAIRELHAALETDADFPVGHFYLGKAYAEKGQRELAIEELTRANNAVGFSPQALGTLGQLQEIWGHTREAHAVLEQLEQAAAQRYVPASSSALIFAGRGDARRALDLLEQACEEHSPQLVWIKLDPSYDRLRAESRFQALLEKMGLS